ncbi:MAG: amidohydrolase family protein [Thermoplasmatota archaeon]
MQSYNGPFLTEEGFVEAKIILEDDKIVEFEEGSDEGDERAIIIPSFYNAHTHVGDSVVEDPPNGTIEEVVGPGGIKEKSLSKATNEKMISAIKEYFKEMIEFGVTDMIDFREDGINGLQPLQNILGEFGKKIRPRILSRPMQRKFDGWELNGILSMAHGIGLSAYRDWEQSQIKKVADSSKKRGKPFALHCSEDVREPIDEVLKLGVHHLVHMIEATREDLERCAEENIPVVICPRSNLFFGKIPDIPQMIDVGLDLSLGTDNAMICNPNMFSEMETAYRVSRMNGIVDAEDILMMSTWNPRKRLNLPYELGDTQEKKENYLVLKYRKGDPAYQVVTKMTPKDIIKTVEW